MARGGINKALVKMALDRLLAKGINPSIDAIRTELGNTGSKATIHRYLKELNEESDTSALGQKVPVSEALSQMVVSLAAQLQQEAQDIIDANEAKHKAAVEVLQAKLNAQESTNKILGQENLTLTRRLAESDQTLESLSATHRELTLNNGKAEQELAGKETLLAEKGSHIRSLEEKHQHAREALEHYRQSVKDQRDQDQRRHEHQVQQLQAEIRQLNQTLSIKQTDLAQLNTANAELSAELRQLRKALNDSEHQRQTAESRLSVTTEQHATAKQQLIELTGSRHQLLSDKENVQTQQALLDKALKTIEIELATVKTELAVKNQLLESLGHSLQPITHG